MLDTEQSLIANMPSDDSGAPSTAGHSLHTWVHAKLCKHTTHALLADTAKIGAGAAGYGMKELGRPEGIEEAGAMLAHSPSHALQCYRLGNSLPGTRH